MLNPLHGAQPVGICLTAMPMSPSLDIQLGPARAPADNGHGKDRGRNDHGKNRGRIQYGVAAGHQPRQYRTAWPPRSTRGQWPWPRQGPWLGLQPRPSRGTCSAGNAEEFDLGRPSRTARGPRGNGGAGTDDYRQPPRTARTTRRHQHCHRARAKPTSRWRRQRGSSPPWPSRAGVTTILMVTERARVVLPMSA